MLPRPRFTFLVREPALTPSPETRSAPNVPVAKSRVVEAPAPKPSHAPQAPAPVHAPAMPRAKINEAADDPEIGFDPGAGDFVGGGDDEG
mgnify:CR=1 FL=1